MTITQSYSRQVCPQLVHLKKRTSLSSADRSWRSHHSARLCSHFGHFVAIVGRVLIAAPSSTITISRSLILTLFFIWGSPSSIFLIYPHFRHFRNPAEDIMRLLHSGQNIRRIYRCLHEMKSCVMHLPDRPAPPDSRHFS